MALPTQEIEKIVRGPAAAQGAYKQLLLLSGTLFGISLIIYLGLTYGYEPYLQRQVSDLDSQIQSFAKEVPTSDQANLTAFYSQLVNLKTLLSKHPSTLGIFTWLEKNTEENTYFTKFSFNATTYQLNLTGISKTEDDVAMQSAVLESQPEVIRMNLNSLSAASAGGWQFNLVVFLDPKAFGAVGAAPALAPVSTSTAPAASAPTSTAPGATSTPAKPLSVPQT